jgi:hypothetical protein
MPNPNPDINTKIDYIPHKLAIKRKIRTIKTQVDWFVAALIFLNLEANSNLVQFNYLNS